MIKGRSGLAIAIIMLLLLLTAGCSDDDVQHSSAPTATPSLLPTATIAPTPAPISGDLGAAVNGGGCYPTKLVLETPLDMLALVDPEWSPVMNGTSVDSDPMLVHGTILGGHGDTGGDFPSTHVRSDQNTFIRVDPADFGLVATGNDVNQSELELALEWEAGAYPDWAWGSPGDRITALGRWIFDCGHPGSQPGHCSATANRACVMDEECRPGNCPECAPEETCEGEHFGYSSEIHPPYATAVVRRGRGAVVASSASARAIAATRADIFISPYGGGAGDRCVLTHLPNPVRLLKSNCYPLQEPIAPAHLNQRDFVFDVPLPPGSGQPIWRFENRDTPGGIAPVVDVVAHLDVSNPYLQVTVRMTQPTSNGLPTGYAATMFSGWDSDTTAHTHVRVSIDSVMIHHPLQPRQPVVPRICTRSQQPCTNTSECALGETCYGVGPVKHWRLQVSVNGEWRELQGLEAVDAGQVVPQNISYDQYLPANGAVQVIANGVCEDCINTIFGQGLAVTVEQLGFVDGLSCLLSTPHNAGEVNATYGAPSFGAGGIYETRSRGGDGGHCSGSDAFCLTSTDCNEGESCNVSGGAFSLRYRIERLD